MLSSPRLTTEMLSGCYTVFWFEASMNTSRLHQSSIKADDQDYILWKYIRAVKPDSVWPMWSLKHLVTYCKYNMSSICYKKAMRFKFHTGWKKQQSISWLTSSRWRLVGLFGPSIRCHHGMNIQTHPCQVNMEDVYISLWELAKFCQILHNTWLNMHKLFFTHLCVRCRHTFTGCHGTHIEIKHIK